MTIYRRYWITIAYNEAKLGMESSIMEISYHLVELIPGTPQKHNARVFL